MWPAKSRHTSLLVLLSDRLLWLSDDGGSAPGVSGCLEVPISHTEDGLQSLRCALTSLAGQLTSTLQVKGHRQLNVLVSDQWMICDVLPWSNALMGREALSYVMENLLAAGYRVGSNDTLRADDRVPGKPCWVACFSANLLEALQSFAEQVKQPLMACLPTGPALCRFLARKVRVDGPIGILDGEWLRFYQVSRQTCQPIGCSLPVKNEQAIALAWQRVQLAYAGISHAERLQLVNLVGDTVVQAANFPILSVESPMCSGTEQPHQLAWLARIVDEDHPLAYRPVRGKRHYYAKWVEIGFLVMLVGLLGWGLVEIEAEIDSHLKMMRTASQASLRPASPPSVDKALPQSAITLLNFPFEESLRALIPQDSASIYLFGIELDNETAPSTIRVTGQGRMLDDVGVYIKYLSANSRIGHVELLRHEKVQENSALPLRFELEVTWRD